MSKREPPVRWAPRLQPAKLKRLYEIDAQGMLDDDLLDEVGSTLYSRCQSILHVSDAMNGKVHCPQCDTIIQRQTDDTAEVLVCPACNWQARWEEYVGTYRSQELGAGGAADMFRAFVLEWEQVRGAREKMVAIDQLIHRWHWETAAQQPTFGLGRPTGLNLIEGNRQQVLSLLDSLTYGASSTPGLAATNMSWRQHRQEVQERLAASKAARLSVPIPVGQLTHQLRELGVTPGGVLLVHCAFSKVKPVEHGPEGQITALQTAVGLGGTLVMPSMTDDDDQPFDPRSTPCRHLGVVANTFWQLPGVLRSDSPHAFAARGAKAALITEPHPLDMPHGLDSPVGRIYELDGQVLLLGVGHDDNTTIHLAEALAGVRYRRKQHVTVWRDGQPTRVDYGEIDHCCQNFQLVDGWLEAAKLQRRGKVGHATARLIRARDIVRVVVEQLQRDETVFLHPIGDDAQCDEARASLLAAQGTGHG